MFLAQSVHWPLSDCGMKKLRVLHVVPTLLRGGAERLVTDIIRELNMRPYVDAQLVVVSNLGRGEDGYLTEAISSFVTFIPSWVRPSISGKWSVNLEGFQDFVDKYKPDVIHSHLFESEIVTGFRPEKSVSYFTHCHDNMPQLKAFAWSDLLSKRRFAELYERNFLVGRLIQRKSRFVAISPDTASYFRANLPVEMADRIHLLPNAIDTERFGLQRAGQPKEGTPLRLVNVGSFVTKKNQGFLLEVLLSLHARGVDATLALAGDGPLRKEVESKAGQLGLSGKVSFLGITSNVEQELWKSHLYLHSATYEPFGLAIVEAMAAGLPVVALDGKGNVDLHRDGENGFLVRQQDPDLFASRILECSKPDVHARMSAAAIEFSKGFGIAEYVDKLLDIYRSTR
jgi:glycosyltransferase involved in cell wall biosynthesis